ncbi:efflux RND transporter periplasmic adaptor subunit [Telmatocola sphagniphila]|uniref:Efflux RND transporter periplasmic adaptor subunit n=1 Tax=Telmatocola sphagniphila TaxID=1123043 RepID=A0A8E6B8A9_9BACT|nr:efflux RND transporter periplasmic adaptor subunit [Telmatocola sphagniphila]QVL32373.1 efflux RND transporter periplasmic adaptor subunit [Telmatocola sphagniphila]
MAATPAPAPSPEIAPAPQSSPVLAVGQRLAKGFFFLILVGVVLSAFAFSLGIQLPSIPLHAREPKQKVEPKQKPEAEPPTTGVSLFADRPHSLEVPEEVRTVLGIRKGNKEMIEVAKAPTLMKPLVLPGSTALDPTRLARIRARFAPARVVEIGQVADINRKTGQTEFRELRPGDHVRKGDVLGVFYSVDVGSKKNDLLDALVQLELDQKILDQSEEHREAVPEVFMLGAIRAVQGDRNAINRALNNLEAWDIPQEDIDALQAEAKKISADKNAWLKTKEGRWVKGEKAETNAKGEVKVSENPWGRVTLRAPFDGIIVERNLHVDEMVVDNTVNLFQVAEVNRLLVIANAPEDQLPTLEALNQDSRKWSIRTTGADAGTGLPGHIDEIGYLIDPNQHTAVIKGYVENPGLRLRAGQYVSATVPVSPPADVVEIPIDALIDDGNQSVVFVQMDPSKPIYTMRRVQVTHRYEKTVFVRSKPFPKDEQLTEKEAEDGLLPREELKPGERVVYAGTGELKSTLIKLESQAKKDTKEAAKP